eukprot:343713-Lingulodinium_polyedra.AAC.1
MIITRGFKPSCNCARTFTRPPCARAEAMHLPLNTASEESDNGVQHDTRRALDCIDNSTDNVVGQTCQRRPREALRAT